MCHHCLLRMFFNLVAGVSVDCPNLINLALGMGIKTQTPSIWTQLEVDCCLASGITCLSQRVTEIGWYSYGLTGFINGTAIPTLVKIIDLFSNSLTGNFPVLPSGLQYLDLSENRLYGTLPTSLPLGLTTLFIDDNYLSGDLPVFPSSLVTLGLGYPGSTGTHFTGTLRLNAPTFMKINNNWITDVVIQINTGLSTSSCDLSNNPLLGNPNIVGLPCLKNALYSASLLPKTLTATSLIFRSLTSKNIQTSTTVYLMRTNLFQSTNLQSKQSASAATSSFNLSSNITSSMITISNLEMTPVIRQTGVIPISSEYQMPFQISQNLLTSFIIMINTTSVHHATNSVAFAPRTSTFEVNWKVVLRVIINAFIASNVISRSPFKREFKRMATRAKNSVSSEIIL